MLLGFAHTLQTSLETGQPNPNLLTILKKHMQDFPTNISVAAAARYEDLDAHGTALWNLTTRLKRNIDTDAELQQLSYGGYFV